MCSVLTAYSVCAEFGLFEDVSQLNAVSHLGMCAYTETYECFLWISASLMRGNQMLQICPDADVVVITLKYLGGDHAGGLRPKQEPKSKPSCSLPVAGALNHTLELNIYCGRPRPAEWRLRSCQKQGPSRGRFSSSLLAADLGPACQ